jgi:hypothetical protein
MRWSSTSRVAVGALEAVEDQVENELELTLALDAGDVLLRMFGEVRVAVRAQLCDEADGEIREVLLPGDVAAPAECPRCHSVNPRMWLSTAW